MDIARHFPVKFTQHTDPLGAFCEVVRLGTGGQVFVHYSSWYKGNHFHTKEKIELLL